MQRILVYFLLFWLPFLIFPLGGSHFETPKVIVAEILIDVLLLYYLFSPKSIKIKKSYLFLVAILFVLTIFDLIFFRSNVSLFGNPFRLQGIFLFWHLFIFSIISSRIVFQKLPQLFFLLPLVGLLVSVPLFGNNLVGRAIGTLGEPNFLAAYAIFVWPFLISSRENKKNKFILVFSIIATVIILALTRSHSAMIGFGIQILFFFLTLFAKIKIKLSLLICLFVLSATLVLPFITPRNLYEDRVTIWQISGQAIIKNPILGYGFGNVEEILKSEINQQNSQLQGYYVDSAHNFLLDYLMSGGVIAAISIILIIKIAFNSFVNRDDARNISLLLGVIAVMFFNPSGVTTLIAFWWLMGQGAKNLND